MALLYSATRAHIDCYYCLLVDRTQVFNQFLALPLWFQGSCCWLGWRHCHKHGKEYDHVQHWVASEGHAHEQVSLLYLWGVCSHPCPRAHPASVAQSLLKDAPEGSSSNSWSLWHTCNQCCTFRGTYCNWGVEWVVSTGWFFMWLALGTVHTVMSSNFAYFLKSAHCHQSNRHECTAFSVPIMWSYVFRNPFNQESVEGDIQKQDTFYYLSPEIGQHYHVWITRFVIHVHTSAKVWIVSLTHHWGSHLVVPTFLHLSHW